MVEALKFFLVPRYLGRSARTSHLAYLTQNVGKLGEPFRHSTPPAAFSD